MLLRQLKSNVDRIGTGATHFDGNVEVEFAIRLVVELKKFL